MLTILQLPGLFGGPEVLIFLLVWTILAAFIGRWVYRDAKSRGSNWAWQWGVGIAILLVGVGPGLLALLVYFLIRGDKTQTGRQPG
jgi:hypothetical protein